MKLNNRREVSSKKKLTIEELKAASQSVKTGDALAKIVGGTLSNCHFAIQSL